MQIDVRNGSVSTVRPQDKEFRFGNEDDDIISFDEEASIDSGNLLIRVGDFIVEYDNISYLISALEHAHTEYSTIEIDNDEEDDDGRDTE